MELSSLASIVIISTSHILSGVAKNNRTNQHKLLPKHITLIHLINLLLMQHYRQDSADARAQTVHIMKRHSSKP